MPDEGIGVIDKVDTDSEEKVDKPKMYNVVMHNDDFTPHIIPVMVLTQVFKKTQAQAVEIMLHVHNNGIGICGVYSKDIAETKQTQSMDMAKEMQCALLLTVEPDE